MSDVKLTKEQIDELISKNEGFSQETTSSNGQGHWLYFIKDGAMYVTRYGKVPGDNYRDTEKCDSATKKRILERYYYRLNK